MADTILRLDPEIIIGLDTVNRAGTFCANLGKKVFIATEHELNENKLVERLIRILEDEGLETILFDAIPAQATAEIAENAASLAHAAHCDMIVGFGSYRTQYTARLASILAASPIRLFEILDGEREEHAFLPYVAIPVFGGDPFFLSDNLITVDPRNKLVKLIKCPKGQCKTAILDSNLSEQFKGPSASGTIFEGLCSSLEAYCSNKSNFLSDNLLERAISLYAKTMNSLTNNPPAELSTACANAALLAAMGISVSPPGIGTALACALSGKFPVAKSSCATILLPHVMQKLISARPEKMAKVAALMGEKTEGASVSDAANMTANLVRRRMSELSIPTRLKDFNLVLDRLVPAAKAGRNLDFIAFSPWTVSSEDAYDLIKQAF